MKLSDFMVDGMPADQRIKELKDQVKRLLDLLTEAKEDVLRWTEERFKWYKLANEYKNKFESEEKRRKELETEVDRKETVINELNYRVTELELENEEAGITPEDEANLGLLVSLREILRKILGL